MAFILDAGALIACERGDRCVIGAAATSRASIGVPIRTSAAVVAQVWRGGSRQAWLARALVGTVEEALDPERARSIGALLGPAGMSDVVDAAVVDVAQDGDEIVTADPDDIAALVAASGRRVVVSSRSEPRFARGESGSRLPACSR